MNDFFRHVAAGDDEGDWPQPPAWLIGKLVHIEFDPAEPVEDSHPERQQRRGRWVFEAIGYDWLLQQGLLTDTDAALAEKFALGQSEHPLATVPLYRLELDIRWPPYWSWRDTGTTPRWTRRFESLLSQPPDVFGELEALNDGDVPWLKFRLDSPQPGRPAALYRTVAGPPLAVRVRIHLPSAIVQAKLEALHAAIAAGIAEADAPTLQALLQHVDPKYLAVYDVGQGNANALLSDRLAPVLYYDVGAAITHNQHTRPAASALCFCRQPPIVLSHWDMDHWAGACAASTGAVPAAYRCAWIAPPLPKRPMALALAAQITGAAPANPKRLVAFPSALSVEVTLPSGDRLRLARGTGSGANASCIVMSVSRIAGDGTSRSWLLTGDCDYGSLPAGLPPQDVIGLVVPHHGAAGSGAPSPPSPGQTYRRLAYSFGPGNHFGKVRHAMASCVQAHANAGWGHASWSPANVFHAHPGGDARITAAHAAGAPRGSILIGWQPYSQPTAHYACGCGVGIHFQL